MVECVARALAEHSADNWETCLKAPGQRRAGMYRSQARSAIRAVRQALVEEAESMKFSEDRNALLTAVESLDEALK